MHPVGTLRVLISVRRLDNDNKIQTTFKKYLEDDFGHFELNRYEVGSEIGNLRKQKSNIYMEIPQLTSLDFI